VATYLDFAEFYSAPALYELAANLPRSVLVKRASWAFVAISGCVNQTVLVPYPVPGGVHDEANPPNEAINLAQDIRALFAPQRGEILRSSREHWKEF
jgi:hypothetical protein